MNRWSNISLENLAGVRGELRAVADRVLQIHDIRITCGRRTYEQQVALIKMGGVTKIKNPAKSRHVLVDDKGVPAYDNVMFDDDGLPLSEAVDFIPIPFLGWNHPRVKYQFSFVAGIWIAEGKAEGVNLEWGADFDGDGDPDDFDFPHIQISRKESSQ